MMDLKEIIKWFIPCFHILLMALKLKDCRLTFLCLLLFSFRTGLAAEVHSAVIVKNETKNLNSLIYDSSLIRQSNADMSETNLSMDNSVGRTFGRPFKKMIGAMLPLIFQIGAASTWAVVAAIVGVKTLAVTLLILKLLLIAGAAKFGALFAQKGHHGHGWEAPHQPQKEIHLHIHNGGHHQSQEEFVPAYGPWNREGATAADTKNSIVLDPYSMLGPQTIKTPFGNYVKVQSNDPLTTVNKRK